MIPLKRLAIGFRVFNNVYGYVTCAFRSRHVCIEEKCVCEEGIYEFCSHSSRTWLAMYGLHDVGTSSTD